MQIQGKLQKIQGKHGLFFLTGMFEMYCVWCKMRLKWKINKHSCCKYNVLGIPCIWVINSQYSFADKENSFIKYNLCCLWEEKERDLF